MKKKYFSNAGFKRKHHWCSTATPFKTPRERKRTISKTQMGGKNSKDESKKEAEDRH